MPKTADATLQRMVSLKRAAAGKGFWMFLMVGNVVSPTSAICVINESDVLVAVPRSARSVSWAHVQARRQVNEWTKLTGTEMHFQGYGASKNLPLQRSGASLGSPLAMLETGVPPWACMSPHNLTIRLTDKLAVGHSRVTKQKERGGGRGSAAV